jgi:hypothetical protein
MRAFGIPDKKKLTAKTPRPPRKTYFQDQKTWRSWRLGGSKS